MLICGIEVKVVCSDITLLVSEAIVNPANDKLLMGGGVAGAIKKTGGKEIEDEAVSLGSIRPGEAVVTKAGSLPARYVIHAATMSMDFRTDEHKIRSACRSALRAAVTLNIRSLALPALGCGTGGFSYKAAAKIMAQEVFRYIREDAGCLKEIIFCLNDSQAAAVFEKNALGYLEYMAIKLKQPFLTVDAIIEISLPGGRQDKGIVIIKRSNPPFGWALPGGFVDYGESLEQAVARESREETGLEIKDVRQFHTYSDPRRDPRFHTVGTVFIAQGEGQPVAGDDAAEAKIVTREDIPGIDFAFDHRTIIEDYILRSQRIG